MKSSRETDDKTRVDSTDESKPNSLGKRLVWGLLICVAVVSSLWAFQRLTAPNVDASLTKPLEISNGDRASSSPVAGESEAQANSTPDLNLPENCLTAGITQQTIDDADHPLEPLIQLAEATLEEIDRSVEDYTATMISQVFVDDKLQDEKYLACKIRNQRTGDDGTEVPFSVYTKFLKPANVAGQEAIWVFGRNDDKLIAHATGLMNLKRVHLDPDGRIAMSGNRYPIRDIGIRNLVVKMIDFAKKDLQYDECSVSIKRNVTVNERTCTVIEAVHPFERPHFEAHISRIYLDDERNIPIAFEGYLWPEKKGDEPPLLEKYYYTDVKINAGLTDEDFDPGNEAYNYPSW
jgi:hypothetical protein